MRQALQVDKAKGGWSDRQSVVPVVAEALQNTVYHHIVNGWAFHRDPAGCWLPDSGEFRVQEGAFQR